MFASPISLEEACLNVFCDNILIYIEPQIQTKEGWTTNIEGSDCYDDERSDKRYKFRDPDIYLFNRVSEKLMNKMLQKRILCDATLNIFSKHNTTLKSVKIRNCKVTSSGLQVLKQHKITDIDVGNLRNVDVGDVLDSLSDWSKEHLRSANFAECECPFMVRGDFLAKVTSFKQLKSLSIPYTQLNLGSLTIICEGLKFLERLDISGTSVNFLQPLEALSSTLVSLTLRVSLISTFQS